MCSIKFYSETTTIIKHRLQPEKSTPISFLIWFYLSLQTKKSLVTLQTPQVPEFWRIWINNCDLELNGHCALLRFLFICRFCGNSSEIGKTTDRGCTVQHSEGCKCNFIIRTALTRFFNSSLESCSMLSADNLWFIMRWRILFLT